MESNQQRGGQAWALSGGDRVNVPGLNSCSIESGPGDRQQVAEVFASGQLWNDPAILLVQIDLGRNSVGQDAPVLDHCGTGLIAGRLESKERRHPQFLPAPATRAAARVSTPRLLAN
jgi:hypothetical protein